MLSLAVQVAVLISPLKGMKTGLVFWLVEEDTFTKIRGKTLQLLLWLPLCHNIKSATAAVSRGTKAGDDEAAGEQTLWGKKKKSQPCLSRQRMESLTGEEKPGLSITIFGANGQVMFLVGYVWRTVRVKVLKKKIKQGRHLQVSGSPSSLSLCIRYGASS